jgi:hypothetical protein
VVCKQIIILLRTVHSYLRLSLSHNITLLPGGAGNKDGTLPARSSGAAGAFDPTSQDPGGPVRSNARRLPPAVELLRGSPGSVSFSFSEPPFSNAPIPPTAALSSPSDPPCPPYDDHSFVPVPTPFGVLTVTCLSANARGLEKFAREFRDAEGGERSVPVAMEGAGEGAATQLGGIGAAIIQDYTQRPDLEKDRDAR